MEAVDTMRAAYTNDILRRRGSEASSLIMLFPTAVYHDNADGHSIAQPGVYAEYHAYIFVAPYCPASVVYRFHIILNSFQYHTR